jgi:hypothetical protein
VYLGLTQNQWNGTDDQILLSAPFTWPKNPSGAFSTQYSSATDATLAPFYASSI